MAHNEVRVSTHFRDIGFDELINWVVKQCHFVATSSTNTGKVRMERYHAGRLGLDKMFQRNQGYDEIVTFNRDKAEPFDSISSTRFDVSNQKSLHLDYHCGQTSIPGEIPQEEYCERKALSFLEVGKNWI
jgi:hypothetical protein